MSKKIRLQKGKNVLPIFTPGRGSKRAFVESADEQGPFVACRLGNKRWSKLYGWYVLVSPEDVPLMREYVWCANLCNRTGPSNIVVRRRYKHKGKEFSSFLRSELWMRMNGCSPPSFVYLHGHPFDYRRSNLTLSPTGGRCRGVTSSHNTWQVQITLESENRYIGSASTPEEGYRMFNRYLRDLKRKEPEHAILQSLEYNQVDPLF